MPYPQDFFERSLGQLTGASRLVECLLWRGFLAELKNGHVWLLKGSHDDDISLLQECGLQCELVNDIQNDYVARISVTDDLEVLSRVFFATARNGRTAPPMVNENFTSFKSCRFGAKVPVRHLDPGVALFVKTLAAAGVCTVMSCDGHFTHRPEIWVRTEWDLHWCNYVLKRVAAVLNIPSEHFWNFVVEDGNSWLRFRFQWNIKPDNSLFESFMLIQQFSRVLLDHDFTKNLRAEKEAIGTQQDFDQRYQINNV